MQEKDRCLKKNNLNILFKIIFFLFFSCNCVFANPINEKQNIIEYINSLQNFSANFIQSDGISIEEGVIYIGKDRVRADYLSPSKITLIMDNDKAMFVNHELKEVQYFDPRDSSAGIFFDIFQNSILLYDSEIKIENLNILLTKYKKINNENYTLKIFFEKSPYILRKLDLNNNNLNIVLSLSNHKYNNLFKKNFFSMANPFLNN